MNRYLVASAALVALCTAPAFAQVFPAPGIDNSARITQTGNNNEATIDQAVNGLINGQNQAEISQSSNAGRAMISQTTATSPRPGGFANTASIDQRRARTSATVEQIHDYQQAFGNEANITQIAADAAAAALQRGDRNFINIRQLNGSVMPVASVQQNGIWNRAVVRQGGTNGTVIVRQGDYTNAVGASPVSSRSRATIDNNGVNSTIYVNQVGFGNEATIFEQGNSGLIDADMYGDQNITNIDQRSTNGTIILTTTGASFNNLSDIRQEISDFGSSATILQAGAFATANVTQKDLLGLGGNNQANVQQSGFASGLNNVVSTITQDGGSNLANVNQMRSLAVSTVTQTGFGHVSTISQ
ncbi:hypothetical protein [Hyphomonas sp.]|uniref:hypothetical protein n=1 Tax=Hyphomonas sp. TaxID=87 RepID=UPI0039197760